MEPALEDFIYNEFMVNLSRQEVNFCAEDFARYQEVYKVLLFCYLVGRRAEDSCQQKLHFFLGWLTLTIVQHVIHTSNIPKQRGTCKNN